MAPGTRCSQTSQSTKLSSGSNESTMVCLLNRIHRRTSKGKNISKKAQNLTLRNFTDRGGPKPKVLIPTGKIRPVGLWAKEFGSELGIICKQNIPLTCHSWKDVKENFIEVLYTKVEDKCDVDASQIEFKEVIDDCLKNRLTEKRPLSTLFGIPDGLNKCSHPESSVKQEEWESLCTHFESEKFQRDAVTGIEPDQIQFYQNMRWSADKGWNVPEARDNYEKMVDLRSQSVKEGEAPLTEAEISVKVLGKRLGYVKGLGYGKIPPAGQARATYYGGAVNQLQTTEERNREIMRLRKLLETPHEQSVAQQQLIEAQARKQEDNLGNKRNKIVS